MQAGLEPGTRLGLHVMHRLVPVIDYDALYEMFMLSSIVVCAWDCTIICIKACQRRSLEPDRYALGYLSQCCPVQVCQNLHMLIGEWI